MRSTPVKLFADEEAIETKYPCISFSSCVTTVKLFADEEAIETSL